jgi:tellurite resistance protein TerC
MLWTLFAIIIGSALFIDLGLKNNSRHTHAVSLREAACWTLVWVALALGFAGVIYFTLGKMRSLEFVTGYLLEESLSVDNMFVFVLIFEFFAIPALYQARVLKYGILGAIVMRFVIIFAGVGLVQRFHWMYYAFGLLLLGTAIRLLTQKEEAIDPARNPVLRLFKRFMPFSLELDGNRFFTRRDGVRLATPLFATLLVVEASDLIFATDSIPAVLAVSNHPLIVVTSNIFAILGLRSLFFLISGFMRLFRYLKVGLSVVLIFIAIKMLLVDLYPIPIGVSLLVVAGVLSASVLASLRVKPPPS